MDMYHLFSLLNDKLRYVNKFKSIAMLNGYSYLSCQCWAEIASVSGKHVGVIVVLSL